MFSLVERVFCLSLVFFSYGEGEGRFIVFIFRSVWCFFFGLSLLCDIVF